MSPSSQTSERLRRGGRTPEPLNQRIRRLADKSGNCWLWTGRLDKDGYGRITVNQRPGRAHRVAYETFVGAIPEGMEIDHLCRVRHCVKPDHLEPVPHQLNVARAFSANDAERNPDECLHGHVLDESNAYLVQGSRQCRECHRKRNREYAARKRAELRLSRTDGAK